MKVKYMNTEETYRRSSDSSKLNDERKNICHNLPGKYFQISICSAIMGKIADVIFLYPVQYL